MVIIDFTEIFLIVFSYKSKTMLLARIQTLKNYLRERIEIISLPTSHPSTLPRNNVNSSLCVF